MDNNLFWFKFHINTYESEAFKLIDAMPKRDAIHFVYVRLMILAAKTNKNGYIYFDVDTPYSEEMLSTIINRSIGIIRHSLKALIKVKLISIGSEGYIRINNWEKEQGSSFISKVKSEEEILIEEKKKTKEKNRKRMAEYRAKKKNVTTTSDDTVTATGNEGVDVTSNSDVTEHKESKELDLDKEDEIKREIESQRKEAEEVNALGYKVLSYYEHVTGKIGVFNLQALCAAIKVHGEKNVRLAIDRALAVNKVSMTYVNGILNNWAKEGYPKEKVVKDGGEFSGFKANEPEGLSEEERRRAKDLI
ncbi:phage replisome organizer N-terminal domain-containing protein [Clostridium paraputrificum]|uniref:phage replisome organizer N-terminal domain-containing protein n=1 Tax=Clostridium paraputrificum TaxID=29363 RepID=UPI0018986807|nr:phage replisome organizer N-terminal domain-containing protein [Clostridium paraputrificum]MDC0800727.1 phage replisome organizer N-terminal domain-containing protein [Clostridium paraputrificum]